MGDGNNNGGGAGQIGSIIQAGVGAYQAIRGAHQENKYTKKYTKLIEGYKENQGIMDYYNQALSRYGVSPTDSALYKRSMRDVGRNQATALNALQDRRSALGGVGSILRASNDAALNAEANAEASKDQRFNALGVATGAKAQEDKYKFEALGSLYGSKATGGANVMNAGLSNIYGAGNSLSQMAMVRQMYGNGSNGGGGGYNSSSNIGTSIPRNTRFNQNGRI